MTPDGPYAYPLLLKQLVRNPLLQSRDQEIVYRDMRRMSYAAFGQRISQLASALRTEMRVQPGDTVGVMDWDSDRFLEALFAVPMMGAVLQTINVRLSAEHLAYTINHAGASVILVHEDFTGLLDMIRPHLVAARRFVVMRDRPTPGTVAPFDADYEELLQAAWDDYDFPDFDERTQATAFYTSGTTGPPKGVSFSHRAIVLHTLSLLARLGLAPRQGRFDRDSVYMPMTPMFHVHAWGFPWAATAAGVKQVYPGRYEPGALLRLIQAESVTFTHCVPTILQMLLSAPESPGVDLSRLTMAVGGSDLPPSLARQAMARGIDVFGAFGMSETGPVLTMAQLDAAQLAGGEDCQVAARTEIGFAGPLVEIRVVDPAMKDVAHDGMTVGEMVVRAPWLTEGYLKDHAASTALWAGGYLHTGDLVTISRMGRIRVMDRMKDVVKTGGEWVSSVLLESLISQAADVHEVAVIGVSDTKWGERPLAVIVPHPQNGSVIDAVRIRKHLEGFVEHGILSRIAIPDRIMLVDQLPRTSVGKIDKKRLRTIYGSPSEPAA